MKRLLPLVLSICMLFTIGIQPATAVAMNENVKESSAAAVPALEYQSVADKIAVAQEETTVQIGTETVHYYWGENSFVVQNSSGYYHVTINESFTQFFVNGKAYDITRESNNTGIAIPNDVTYPTGWSTVYDETLNFDVAGLGVDIVAGLIGSYLGGFVSNKIISEIVSNLASEVAGFVIDGVFAPDFVVTIDYYKSIRMLGPIEMEHFDAVGVYLGTTDNPMDTRIYYGTDNYVREYPE